MSFSPSPDRTAFLEEPRLEESEPRYPVKDLPTPNPVKGHVLFKKCRRPADREKTLSATAGAIEVW